jgi:asparaginyl-tRNA synthetase
MNQTYIRDVASHAGEEIVIRGWLYNIRSSGKLMFPQIRDGSGIIQGVVFKKNVPEQVWNDFAKLTQESSIVVRGTRPSSRGDLPDLAKGARC